MTAVRDRPRLPPPWRDAAAVRARVDAEIEELRSEVERRSAYFPPLPVDDRPDVAAVAALMHDEAVTGWPLMSTERAAVAAARRGDTEHLADLVRPIPGLGLVPDDVNPNVARLSVETWALIAEFVAGERSVSTGRGKNERGRPRMSRAQKRARSAGHGAVAEVPAIRAILRRLYPKMGIHAIVRRADRIAQRRANIATSMTNLRRRARRGR